MKIKSFAVNNFRGISGGLEKNKILFEDTNAIFIFGQNNVGKSSILKAYEAFYDENVNINTDFNYINDSSNIEIEVEVYISEAEDRPFVDTKAPGKWDNLVSKYLDDNNVMKIRKEFIQSGKNKVLNSTWKYDGENSQFDSVAYGGIGLHTVFKSLMLRPLYIKAMPTENEVETIVTAILKKVAEDKLNPDDNKELQKAQQIIDELQKKMYNPEDIERYKNKVNEKFNEMFTGFNINIDDGASRAKFTHDKIGKDFKVNFNYESSLSNIHINTYEQIGHGSIRIAIFLLMLMQDNLKGYEGIRKDFIVLFEEPELFLHPILTKML